MSCARDIGLLGCLIWMVFGLQVCIKSAWEFLERELECMHWIELKSGFYFDWYFLLLTQLPDRVKLS